MGGNASATASPIVLRVIESNIEKAAQYYHAIRAVVSLDNRTHLKLVVSDHFLNTYPFPKRARVRSADGKSVRKSSHVAEFTPELSGNVSFGTSNVM